MYPKFDALPPEKRTRIINAALQEFARNGYERASTNEITREAEISKGSLFNYFNNKKELYLFLLDYAREVIERIYREADWRQPDIFARMKALGLVKLKVYKEFPQVFRFLKSAASEDAAEVKSEISRLGEAAIADGLERGYRDIDVSKFREDMDIDKMLNIITWTMLSFAEQQREQVDSIDEVGTKVLEEWDDYFEILRRCFYKKEER